MQSQIEIIKKHSPGTNLLTAASMTVEAALILPFFTLIFITFLYGIPFMVFQLQLQMTLEEISQRTAVYAAPWDLDTLLQIETESEEEQWVYDVLKNGTLQIAVAAELTAVCREEGERVGVTGGFRTYGTGVDKDAGLIDVAVIYSGSLKGISHLEFYRVVQRSHRRIWNGRSLCEDDMDTEEEGIVYITPHGAVYHVDSNCTYLNVSMSYHTLEQVSALRNKSGGCYYPCESCEPGSQEYGVYITEYGTRYHKHLQCAAIRRTVQRVPLSQLENRTPCSKCASHIQSSVGAERQVPGVIV